MGDGAPALRQGPTNETGLVKAIVRAIRHEYPTAWILKTTGNPYQVSGVPDLLVCVRGRLYALEVKHQRPGESHQHALGRATAQQRWQLDRIRVAGGRAEVVTTVAAALTLLRARPG